MISVYIFIQLLRSSEIIDQLEFQLSVIRNFFFPFVSVVLFLGLGGFF